MKKNWLIWLGLFFLVLLAGGGFFVYVHFKSRRDFIATLVSDAKRLQDLTGILPSITLTQAGLEAGDGNSDLVQRYHNLFGIKAGSSWTGDIAAPTATHETIEGGVRILVKERTDRSNMFRAYPSYFASMQDWASLLARLYPAAYSAAKAGDINAFAIGLKNGKAGAYATDPTYFAQLAAVFPVAQEVASA